MTDRGGASPTPARPRRRHPALGARIAVTGMSAAALLGIVASLEAHNPPAPTVVDAPPATPTELVIVAPIEPTPTAVADSGVSIQPIQLTAKPVVRAAPSAPAPAVAAPVARTNGSR